MLWANKPPANHLQHPIQVKSAASYASRKLYVDTFNSFWLFKCPTQVTEHETSITMPQNKGGEKYVWQHKGYSWMCQAAACYASSLTL